MEEYHLDQTQDYLNGPPKEQIIAKNYWAAVGLDRFHKDSKAEIDLLLNGETKRVLLKWNSNFSKATMREDVDIANEGGVALAWFVMSVMLNFKYVEQTEIGDGVDYMFIEIVPEDDDLNFLDNHHYVEVSGILEESKTNTVAKRLLLKHNQINRGKKKNEPSSVIVSLFSKPLTVKEIHK